MMSGRRRGLGWVITMTIIMMMAVVITVINTVIT